MDLSNEFTVPVPVGRAWDVLTDVELIAPCLPGAQLQDVEGEEYRGVVKVKVGPITAQYKGAAVFQERDVENRRVVLRAEGRETRGQGSASAVITATMTEAGDGDGVSTHVTLDSDVTIKGKVAQFGRGVIAEVSAKLLTEFVECLEGKLAEEPADVPAGTPDTGEPDAEPPSARTPGARTPGAEAPVSRTPDAGTARGEAAPVDLLGSAGAPLARRALPALAVFVLLLAIGRRRSQKRRL